MSSIRPFDLSRLRGAFQGWLAHAREWTFYRTPPGQSRDEHLVATLLDRTVISLTIQGVLQVTFAPFFVPRVMWLGAAYLLIALIARLVKRKFGARAAWRSGYILALAGIAPYIAISGGIYSHVVASAVMLTISSSFVFPVNTTLLILLVQSILFFCMSLLQTYGFWFERVVFTSPRLTWLLITQMTVNYAIPIVTTIQAYREVLSTLEDKVEELRVAEGESRRLLEAQRRFFWDISHELRSPLTRLNLSVGKVRREATPQAEPSLERMENEVHRLNELIHHLLLLAQLKQGVQFPMNQHFDLVTEVASVCEDAEFEANVAGRDLQFTLSRSAEGGCPMEGCAELLRSAIDNVLRNAIRFAPEGSEVKVNLSKSLTGVTCISVWDRGPGVPEGQIPMLFDPFFRVIPDGPGPLHRSGSGLGLAIAFEAVKKHAGRMFARNRVHGGLVVRLEVPNGIPAELRTTRQIEAHVDSRK